MYTSILLLHTLFMFMIHPLMMMIIIIPSTILYSMLLAKMIKSTWFSMILILILIGAMLILFMYMSSLSPNEMMNIPILSPLMLLPIMIFSPKNLNQETTMFLNPSIKLFSQIQSSTTVLLVMYLLLTMMIIIQITNKNEGPLRSTYDPTTT